MYIAKKPNPTILLVGGQGVEVERLSSLAATAGFSLRSIATQREALTFLMSFPDSADIIITGLGSEGELYSIAKWNYGELFLPYVLIAGGQLLQDSIGEFVQLGVRNYLVPPFSDEKFTSIIKNLELRSKLHSITQEPADELFLLNHSITVPSSRQGLLLASSWIEGRASQRLNKNDTNMFVGYVFEFLQNAHEHGNMGLSCDDKAKLMESGKLEEELTKLEKEKAKHLVVNMYITEVGLGVDIQDEGFGFNHNKYLSLTRQELMEKIAQPNGRGIAMTKFYFDSLEYSNSGSHVRLLKHLQEGKL